MSNLTKLYKEALRLENITRTLIQASGLRIKLETPINVPIGESFFKINNHINLGYCAECKSISLLEITFQRGNILQCCICKTTDIITLAELNDYKYPNERIEESDIYMYLDELIKEDPEYYTKEYITKLKYRINEVYDYMYPE